MSTAFERGNRKLQWLDRNLGIPIVFLLGVLRFVLRPSHPQLPAAHTVTRIAILQTAAIGDTLLMTGPLADLHEKYPHAEIHILMGSSNWITRELISTKVQFHLLSIKNPLRALMQILSLGSFDLWLDFGPWPRLNAIYSFFARADIKVGFRSENQFRHYVYDYKAIHSRELHELENQRNIVRALEISKHQAPRVQLMGGTAPEGATYVVLHMFPGGSQPQQKEWPTERWLQLIQYFVSQNLHIYFTGVASDVTRVEQLIAQLSQNSYSQALAAREYLHNVAGKMTLAQTAELLKDAKLVVSVNTGIMHLASILQCNLVSLNGPTSIKRWGSLNKNSVAIQSPIVCSPCLHLGFDYGCPLDKCMQEISTENVLTACKSLKS